MKHIIDGREVNIDWEQVEIIDVIEIETTEHLRNF